MAELTVEISGTDPAILTVGVAGALDLHTYEQVRVELVERLRSDPHDVVFDLAALDFLDSTGLRLLVELAAMASRDRKRCVVVLDGTNPCRRVLQITAVDEILEVVDDLAAAHARLAADRA